jgi:multiple sugar transport system substrate-binding protein
MRDFHQGGKLMKETRKIVAVISILFLLTLAACGEKSAASSGEALVDAMGDPIDPSKVNTELKGEISWWVWGDYEIRGTQDFNKFFPNINIDFVAVPSDEFPEKVLTAFATGIDLPEVINIESAERGQFNNMDVWERLDAAPYNFNKNDVLPIDIPLISNSKGEIVCVQIDNCVSGYMYDRNLAKKYFGTDDVAEMEKLFATLDDFIEKSKIVVAGGDYMFASPQDVLDCVGSVYKEPYTNGNKLNTDNTILPAFQIIERLAANKAIGPYTMWTPTWMTSFSTNKVLFFEGPAWFFSYVVKPADPDSTGKWALMTPPGQGFNRGGTAYAIPKKAKNKSIAWEAIRWFTASMEGSRSFFQAHNATTMYKPAYDIGLFSGEPDPYFGGQNWVAKLNEISVLPETSAPIMGPFDFHIRRGFEQTLPDLMDGKSARETYAKFLTLLAERAPELSR